MTEIRPHISIMHAPWDTERVQMVDRLVAELDSGQNDDWNVICGVQGAGIWDTAKRAWLSCPENFTHQVVLQDDGWPCPNFRGGLKATITIVPDKPISYFYRVGPADAFKLFSEGKRWFIGGMRGGGVCLSLPRQMAIDFVSWAEENINNFCPHDDDRLSMFLAEYSIPMFHTIPSLVEHLGRTSTWNAEYKRRSPVGGSQYAALWIGEDIDPAGVDWNPGKEIPSKMTMRSANSFKRWRKGAAGSRG